MPLKPIIFIPGFPASELLDQATQAVVYPPSFSTLLDPPKKAAFLAEVMNVPGNLIAGPPIASILGGVVQEAQTLYVILKNLGYDISGLSTDFTPIGWDWRLGIGAQPTVDAVRLALDRLSPGKSGNVVAILHSTGGLVFRAFLEQFPAYAACFEQVLTFGIPWRGTLEALHAVAVGESEGFLFIRLISQQEARDMISRAQAAYDLMPPEVLADLSWIPADPGHDYMRQLAATAHPPFPQTFDVLPLTNVCGWGADTWTSTSWDHSKDAGDGTVPLISSAWLQGNKVRTMFLPIGAYATGAFPKPHSQLWDSPPVLQIFREVLSNAAPAPFIAVAADSDEYIDYNSDVTLRMSAIASDGSALPNCIASLNTPGSPHINFSSQTHLNFRLSRYGIQHNVGSDIYRFEVRFDWTGGSSTYPVAIHSV